MHLALLSSSARGMAQAHVMCKSVDRSTLNWREIGWEYKSFTAHVFLEQKHLRVELQGLAIVQVDI
jgi:hypothetical protein